MRWKWDIRIRLDHTVIIAWTDLVPLFTSINNTPPPLPFSHSSTLIHPHRPSYYLLTYLPTPSLTHSLTHSPRLALLFLCFLYLSLSLLALLSLASSTPLQLLRICVLQSSGIVALVYSLSSSSSGTMFLPTFC